METFDQEAVLADKGYDTNPFLNHLGQCGIQAAIPPRSMSKVQRDFDRAIHDRRNRIERTLAGLKQFRRLASRFDRLKKLFQAIAAIV